MIRKLYPKGKTKALNFSYDDGVLQDVRFVELLNKYNLKGTFNLNSGLMQTEFEWIHPSGSIIKRLSSESAKNLYTGHEVAAHTRSHTYLENLSESEILEEMRYDTEYLEKLFGKSINGIALPFMFYSSITARCAAECGFEYCRVSEECLSFAPQSDVYNWKPTVFHLDNNLRNIVDSFLFCEDELAILQVVGHSYDLDTENMWDSFEELLAVLSSDSSICPMTHIELVRYLGAMNKLRVTEDYLYNESDITLWFLINERVISIEPAEKYRIK